MPAFSPETLNLINASWPILLMAIIFYFMLYRPQQKEQKQRTAMLTSLKKGDKVVTMGGIHGTITAINDKVVSLKVAEKVEIEVSKAAVSHLKDHSSKGNGK
jgi:preprotein translocase subunit YajC